MLTSYGAIVASLEDVELGAQKNRASTSNKFNWRKTLPALLGTLWTSAWSIAYYGYGAGAIDDENAQLSQGVLFFPLAIGLMASAALALRKKNLQPYLVLECTDPTMYLIGDTQPMLQALDSEIEGMRELWKKRHKDVGQTMVMLKERQNELINIFAGKIKSIQLEIAYKQVKLQAADDEKIINKDSIKQNITSLENLAKELEKCRDWLTDGKKAFAALYKKIMDLLDGLVKGPTNDPGINLENAQLSLQLKEACLLIDELKAYSKKFGFVTNGFQTALLEYGAYDIMVTVTATISYDDGFESGSDSESEMKYSTMKVEDHQPPEQVIRMVEGHYKKRSVTPLSLTPPAFSQQAEPVFYLNGHIPITLEQERYLSSETSAQTLPPKPNSEHKPKTLFNLLSSRRPSSP